MKTHVSIQNLAATAALLITLACAGAAPAQALEVAGVRFKPQLQVKGTTLQLNGAGVRERSSVALYSAGLYLEKRASTAEEAVMNPGAKQLRVVMLREVNSRDFGELLSRGLVGNSSDEQLSNLIPEIMDLGTLIAQHGKLQPGDSFVIDWSATQGTTIRVQERSQRKPAIEVFAKPDLIGALLRIWLGDSPADARLKAALLGKAV